MVGEDGRWWEEPTGVGWAGKVVEEPEGSERSRQGRRRWQGGWRSRKGGGRNAQDDGRSQNVGRRSQQGAALSNIRKGFDG